jgi:hypothetical protein
MEKEKTRGKLRFKCVWDMENEKKEIKEKKNIGD